MMKHFPGWVELLVFAVLAALSVAIVHSIGDAGAGLFFMTFPIFVFCGVLGLWKGGRLRTSRD